MAETQRLSKFRNTDLLGESFCPQGIMYWKLSRHLKKDTDQLNNYVHRLPNNLYFKGNEIDLQLTVPKISKFLDKTSFFGVVFKKCIAMDEITLHD